MNESNLSILFRSKWLMLLCAFFIMFTNSLVNISVKSLTTDLRDYLNCSETMIQTFTVSAPYILSIPLSLYGSFIIHKVGTSKSLILWTGIATIGWITFAFGVSYKSLIMINIGRFLQGGAFGAMRVSFNAFCVKWFGKKHIAMSMGILRSAHNVSHVLGSWLTLTILKNTWHWNVSMIFKIESLGLMISTTLATIMWLSARANYKMQERMLFNIETQHKQQENINDGEKIKKHKKSIIFEEEGQVAVTKEKRSSLSLDGNSETEKENVSISIDTINNESDSSLKSISYNIEKLGAIKHLQILSDHLKKLFKNPIFIIIVIVGFSYDGTIVCFTGILKRLLIDKFKRAESNIAFEMGFTKYCGFAAPFAGYLIDRIRNREWFMFIAGLCLVFSTFTLFLCKYDNIILLYISLFGISIGQVCYGNSFWPSIASIAGRKYQIVAYGFMGCITSIGAVIIPQIYAQVVDYFGNIVIACFIFAILTSIGLTASIIIIIINNTCYAEIDYINRHLSTPKKLTINDQDGEKEQSK